MTIVVGTAGHIDHGKTTLLRALTGIDADRLPEERRRGMTIDVGYAHLDLADGSTIDFVDVPGHDKLVGNMLVGAGEIDAALLVVAADDGVRAQTREHLALLDALGVAPGIAVITKTDVVAPERVETVASDVRELLAPTSLAGSPMVAASGVSGDGVDALRVALLAFRDRMRLPDRPPTLAIDRVFSVRGRGVVVTGTLRGGPLSRGDTLRLEPDGARAARIRELQVHGKTVERVDGGGRTALNLVGIDADDLHRGMVLTADPAVIATTRILAAFRIDVADRSRGRAHVGTAAVDAAIGRAGRDAVPPPAGRPAGIVRLAAPIAVRPGDRFVLRRGPTARPVGGVVLDVQPPRGISRRRQTPERVGAIETGEHAARLELHGAIAGELAGDVRSVAEDAALGAVDPEASIIDVRAAVVTAVRRIVTLPRDEAAVAAAAVVERLTASGRLVREAGRLRRPDVSAPSPDPAIARAMDRLAILLAAPAPPPLPQAARAAGCPPAGVRELERSGRIVVLDPEIAYEAATYRDLTARALAMASSAPVTPAAFRDATGTSRKYVLAILEDLDRRAILRRTPDGHVPGPKAPIATRP